MHSWLLSLPLLLALAADAGAPAQPPSTELDAVVRGLLRKRMEGHGRNQTKLVMAVTLLQRDRVKTLAEDLAAEPRLVRPRPEARDELNSALPERFFVLQDELRTRAIALAQAAERQDDAALAASFGQLVQACVSCHSVFLQRK